MSKSIKTWRELEEAVGYQPRRVRLSHYRACPVCKRNGIIKFIWGWLWQG